MVRRYWLLAALVAGLLSMAGGVWALTENRTVSPAFIKENPKQFVVTTEKRSDGLVHFTITYTVPSPSYLVATTETWENKKLVLQSVATAYVHEKKVTYYLAIAPERVADTKFGLYHGSFGESGGEPVPVPGGIDFEIELGEFAKLAKPATGGKK